MAHIPDALQKLGMRHEGKRRRRSLGCALEIMRTGLLAIVIYLVTRNFLLQTFEVQQFSMFPTDKPGDYLLIDKLSARWDGYHRGDIVVFQLEAAIAPGAVPFIKRIIGLPGETVRLHNGRVFIAPAGGGEVRIDEPYLSYTADSQEPTTTSTGQGEGEWVVAPNHYFVMGDNRPDSEDSRVFGAIAADAILGRAWLRYFPLDRFGFIQRPIYPDLDLIVLVWVRLRPQGPCRSGGSAASVRPRSGLMACHHISCGTRSLLDLRAVTRRQPSRLVPGIRQPPCPSAGWAGTISALAGEQRRPFRSMPRRSWLRLTEYGSNRGRGAGALVSIGGQPRVGGSRDQPHPVQGEVAEPRPADDQIAVDGPEEA
jgi:signal peptidase I